ncbi:MAG: magnesium transporter, partial [Planctomycetota bacterium]
MPDEALQISALERLVRFGSDDDLRRFFLLLRPPELADLLERLTEQERVRVVGAMGAPLASEVLPEVSEPERREILQDLSEESIAEIVQEARSDDAADLLADLTVEKAEKTLGRLDTEERRDLEELMAHDEESAGGLMQTELVKARRDAPVRDAIAAVRARSEEAGEIHEVYVVDARDRLVGTVAVAELLLADPAAPLGALVVESPVAVPVTMDQERLAEVVREHDLAAVPVVDDAGRLVGQILHDDVADVLEEEATEDIAQMAGVDPEEVYGDSVLISLKSRAPWLVPAFAGGLLASVIVRSMEDALRIAPLLAAFLPVVLGMAGNVGTQTSAITVRGLAVGRVDLARAGRVIAKQVLT